MLIANPTVCQFFQLIHIITPVNNTVNYLLNTFRRYIAYIAGNTNATHFQGRFHFLQNTCDTLLQYALFSCISSQFPDMLIRNQTWVKTYLSVKTRQSIAHLLHRSFYLAFVLSDMDSLKSSSNPISSNRFPSGIP
ncbi:MAG: hypothetical protein BWX51_00050 [Bacteroidetes bacterium ADurb.Bin012]|nr:MAG: hypothetical protein BWX51_00050 [Bacteroidetes bacterium ADurb.Bin012]